MTRAGGPALSTDLDNVEPVPDGLVPELGHGGQDTTGQAIFGLFVAVDAGLELDQAGAGSGIHGGEHRQNDVLVAVRTVIAAALGDPDEKRWHGLDTGAGQLAGVA